MSKRNAHATAAMSRKAGPHSRVRRPDVVLEAEPLDPPRWCSCCDEMLMDEDTSIRKYGHTQYFCDSQCLAEWGSGGLGWF